AEKGGLSRPEEELVSLVGEEAVRSVGGPRAAAGDALAVVARAERLGPGRTVGDPAVHAIAVERRELHVALEASEERPVGEQEKRTEGFLGDGHAAVPPRIDPHGVVGRLERQESAARVVAEEQRVVVEGQGERRQLSMPSRRWSSRRAGVKRGSRASAPSSSRMASRIL